MLILSLVMTLVNSIIALIIPRLPGMVIKKGAKFSVKKVGLYIARHMHRDDSDVYIIDGHTVKVHTDVCTMGRNMVAQLNNITKDYVEVTVDGLFWLLSKGMQTCILAHELGHATIMKAYPTKPARYGLMRVIGICPSEEKVADEYALKLCGKENVLAVLGVTLMITPSLELIQRIANIVRK